MRRSYLPPIASATKISTHTATFQPLPRAALMLLATLGRVLPSATARAGGPPMYSGSQERCPIHTAASCVMGAFHSALSAVERARVQRSGTEDLPSSNPPASSPPWALAARSALGASDTSASQTGSLGICSTACARQTRPTPRSAPGSRSPRHPQSRTPAHTQRAPVPSHPASGVLPDGG